MIDSRKNEKARLSMKKIFMLSTLSFLFLNILLIAKFSFLTWVSISTIMAAFFYVLIYVLKSAFWHLIAEAIGTGSFISLPILALLVEVERGKILPDEISLYIALCIFLHLFFGALYIFLVDIPAWGRSSDVNLNKKINLEKGSFDISYPWYFSGAATTNDRARAMSVVGIGAAFGPLMAVFFGKGFIYVPLVLLIAASAVMFWHRIYFAGLLIWLGKKHGKTILLSIYR